MTTNDSVATKFPFLDTISNKNMPKLRQSPSLGPFQSLNLGIFLIEIVLEWKPCTNYAGKMVFKAQSQTN